LKNPGKAIIMAGLSLLAAMPMTARAADEEIQVYIDDMGAPGSFGLDVHNNYVFSGRSTRMDDPLAQDSLHRLRVTPEFSYAFPIIWRRASTCRSVRLTAMAMSASMGSKPA